MARADPSTMRMAASMSFAFMSFIFFSAISLICAEVTSPAKARPGVFDPEPGFFQAVFDGTLREAFVVLLPRESLLLRGGDDAAVDNQRRR